MLGSLEHIVNHLNILISQIVIVSKRQPHLFVKKTEIFLVFQHDFSSSFFNILYDLEEVFAVRLSKYLI